MNVQFEKTTTVSGVLTIKIEKADYEQKVNDELKKQRKRAEIPGFRKGNAPMSLIVRRVGGAVKQDEVEKLLSSSLYNYIRDEKLPVLGQPLQSEKQEPQDIVAQDDFEFIFDLALAPEFDATLTAKDKLPYYDVIVDDARIDEQVKAFAQRAARPVAAEAYTDGDMLRGALVELAEEGGQPLEGGIDVENASLMPRYFADEDQKKLFADAKQGDVITFNPTVAHGSRESELAALFKIEKADVAAHSGSFSFQITEISHMEPAKVDQELFDQIYGKDAVKSEEEFRARIKSGMEDQLRADSDYRFLLDVRKYEEEKIGKLEFADELMKRILRANAKDGEEKAADEDYEKSKDDLQWHLTREKLIEACEVKLENDELQQTAVQAARVQFAQYGMTGVPEEYISQYADNMLKDERQRRQLVDRAFDTKLSLALKNVVTLEHKEVTLEEFNKLFE